MSSTKASSVRSKLLLRSGNLSRLTLWWVAADQWLRATSTPSSKRHLLYFTYSYRILSRVWKLATSLLVFRILWTSISVFNVKTARDVVTGLLIFAKYLSLYLHILTCTYRGTQTQAHMYNQHTRGMATTRHRSLVERGGKKALLEALHTQKKNTRKKMSGKTRYSRI